MRATKLLVVVLLVSSLSGCTWLRESWPWRKKDIPVTPPSEVDAGEPAPETEPETAQPVTMEPQPVVSVPQAAVAGEPFETAQPAPTPDEPQPAEPAQEPEHIAPLQDEPVRGETEAAETVVQARPLDAPAPEGDVQAVLSLSAPNTQPATVPAKQADVTTSTTPIAESGQTEPSASSQPYAVLPPATAKVSLDQTDPLPPEPQDEPAGEPEPSAPAALPDKPLAEVPDVSPAPESAPTSEPAIVEATTPDEPASLPVIEPYATDAQPVEPPAPNLPPLQIDAPVMIENLIPGAAAAEEPPAEAPEPEQAPPAAPEVEAPTPLPAPAPPPPPPIEFGKEEVVAASLLRVNDKFITVDDLLREAGEGLTALPNTLSEEAFRARASDLLQRQARDLVIRTLVYDEAKLRLNEQYEKVVEEDLAEMQRKITAEAGSPQKLTAVLARRGTDLPTLLDAERKRLTVRMFLQARFYPAISVTPRMLWDYYRDHREEFTVDKKVQMQIIAAPYDAFLPEGIGDPSEDERRAAAMRAERQINEAMIALRSGEEFSQVARRLSRGPKAATGGVWPLMAAGSLRETAVEEAAFALEDGQVSEIIQTGAGYYIVKARRVDPGRSTPFEQAQDQIDKKLRDEQFDKLQQEYFARLLQGAQIHQSDGFLPVALERAVREFWRR